MDNLLMDFIRISLYAGAREDLVQAGGGNSSVKLNEKTMLIKASGFQLAELGKDTGYSTVNYKQLNLFFEGNGTERNAMLEKELLTSVTVKGERPSIETFLHSATDVFTLHTHPTVVNALVCRKGGMEELRELFPEALIVGYATPGIALAEAFYKELAVSSRQNAGGICDIVFFQNHGLMVSGVSADEVIQKTENIARKIEGVLGVCMDRYRNSTILMNVLNKLTGRQEIMLLANDYHIRRHMERGGAWNYQFCPDCVVYCGSEPLILKGTEIESEAVEFLRIHSVPSVIVYQGEVYIYARNVKKAKEIESVLSFSCQVSQMNEGQLVELLPQKEQYVLLNWDAEKYRKNL